MADPAPELQSVPKVGKTGDVALEDVDQRGTWWCWVGGWIHQLPKNSGTMRIALSDIC